MVARVIFMGTPEFAVPALLMLADMPAVEVIGVVTRLDKPVGRSKVPEPPPVKAAALARNLPVFQPGSLKKATAQDLLRDLAPDCIIVAAFGQILPQAVLDLPPHGCLNIHASLLPRYRGASPIATAILDGQAETGNTIMLMDVGLDTGAIIVQEALPILPEDTTATLTARLAQQGADLLGRMLPDWLAGSLTPTPQNEAEATMTRLIRKEDGLIDWAMPAASIARRIRAYTPWPGTTTTWNGQPMKIIAAHATTDVTPPSTAVAGQVFAEGTGNRMIIGVVCGDRTALVMETIQLAGKKALSVRDVVRGQPALVGAVLGASLA